MIKPGNKLNPVELRERLRTVRLLSLDVDGVLTDGGLYFGEDGSQLRKFNVRDGVGMKRAQAAGVELCVISSSNAPAILKRAEYLGIAQAHIGSEDKLATLNRVCEELGLGLDVVAHMGDDLPDLEVLRAVGCPLTVANGVPEVRAAAAYVTKHDGGAGAVREICDMLVAVREEGDGG